MIRAEKTQGITSSDRIALLRKAYELSLKNTERHRNEKIMYRQVCEVAVSWSKGGKANIYCETRSRCSWRQLDEYWTQRCNAGESDERILFTSR